MTTGVAAAYLLLKDSQIECELVLNEGLELQPIADSIAVVSLYERKDFCAARRVGEPVCI